MTNAPVTALTPSGSPPSSGGARTASPAPSVVDLNDAGVEGASVAAGDDDAADAQLVEARAVDAPDGQPMLLVRRRRPRRRRLGTSASGGRAAEVETPCADAHDDADASPAVDVILGLFAHLMNEVNATRGESIAFRSMPSCSCSECRMRARAPLGSTAVAALPPEGSGRILVDTRLRSASFGCALFSWPGLGQWLSSALCAPARL